MIQKGKMEREALEEQQQNQHAPLALWDAGQLTRPPNEPVKVHRTC